MKKLVWITLALAAAGILWGFFLRQRGDENGGVFPPAEKSSIIRVRRPSANDIIRSPLLVEGEARGYWFFEASFPVRLLDGNGREISVTPAEAQGEWMTEDFVPFRAELAFGQPETDRGTLVLEKDNPSGLPEHADELRIPVRFSRENAGRRAVRIYYYNQAKDKDASGNIMCSREGLEAVPRSIPITMTPIQDAIRLLLAGELTAEERVRGITTEYPLEGVALRSASLQNGVLTLTFDDPHQRTGGGSCRAGILWFQIEATAKQFPEVREVRFRPESLFQP
ncbi:MAG: hypothetical protein A3B37_00745 [Candidatus Sungbacteria bacterium RIFCSPLOWO2_01_FULL_59_16]|uniref:Bacterial spore germination immunoglobulin-like domain-containing protein n=1 Tax=Candidatus Sungbacteria bacterium RIFCSPLOWO2_01_FULL_59_16 TaxID=1802280 RepID=A0A1G2LDH4_9BACT|nr:MAG: hypothetical protein A3B37_00745 [Candidatus Sungbacteria bacterium RIFCSPLOWO2_01_FULL_59_16]